MLLRKNRAIFPQFDLHTKLESLQRPNEKTLRPIFGLDYPFPIGRP